MAILNEFLWNLHLVKVYTSVYYAVPFPFLGFWVWQGLSCVLVRAKGTGIEGDSLTSQCQKECLLVDRMKVNLHIVYGWV
ncbi:hypothetical protein I79_017179 [Cricetulus griseus]|uniref:Uncharacterized protein n=1 Tax=Cricetulus griseus TaxID=10029 RepID=G3I1C6_CRIGR|nr:hypothetical protein I79_017179 [Cricetulus griseus]